MTMAYARRGFWYLFSQFTCVSGSPIRCLSLSTTVLCLGMPTDRRRTTLTGGRVHAVVDADTAVGSGSGGGEVPLTGPSGCYFGRTFLPVKLTATAAATTSSSSSGHLLLHLHHLVSSTSLSSPAKVPSTGSGRKIRATTAAEASENREGLKGCEASSHMVKGLSSDRLFFTPRHCFQQTAPENTNNTQAERAPNWIQQ
ncbi:hypothetical protein D5F01_LYC01195 [Larimichthys crocea]|uniref:Secreted protein n=1 Tax=Larimichthys crocea TaxID=215358 RepID=A0A6G0JBS2_LARCR|nr:hypothetical protein D5F01_LYC01195 [Larimichthys crocea]